MGWEKILKDEDFQRRLAADMGLTLDEYRAKIREESQASAPKQEQKRPLSIHERIKLEEEKNKLEARKKAGLPPKNITDGAVINWVGECPKCGAKVNPITNTFEQNYFLKSKIDPAFNPRRTDKRKESMRCPYFSEAGKLSGTFKPTLDFNISEIKQVKDISGIGECPMAAPRAKYEKEFAMDISGNKIRNPHYDPNKGVDEI